MDRTSFEMKNVHSRLLKLIMDIYTRKSHWKWYLGVTGILIVMLSLWYTKSLADQLAEFTRTGDIVFRYGGEEFLVAFPNTKEGDAFFIADRLRESIQATPIYVDHHTISITISAGISEFPTHGQYEALILDTADKALYHAKHNGRNQVVLWSKIKTPF